MIFVDTGALLGRYLARDQHHEQAVAGWKRIQTGGIPFLTSNLVLSEAFTLLGRFAGCRFAAETGRLLYGSCGDRILRPDVADERQALELIEKYADQEVSFCDCVSFVLMRKNRVREVFGFDQHFERAGFLLWRGR